MLIIEYRSNRTLSSCIIYHFAMAICSVVRYVKISEGPTSLVLSLPVLKLYGREIPALRIRDS